MTRKGGGKKAFLKGVHKQEEAEQPEPTSASLSKEAAVSQDQSAAANQQSGSSSVPPTAPAAEAGFSALDAEAESDQEQGEETRGHLVQRHKKVRSSKPQAGSSTPVIQLGDFDWHQPSAVCGSSRAAMNLFGAGNRWPDKHLCGLQELKAHKEAMKKLGKKRKDEVAALDQQIEERHVAELLALEQRDSSSKQESEGTDAPGKPVIQGLYEVRLAPQEAPQPKKPTKAQKRKQQQAQREAEREARIAAEQAESGPSQREQEAEQLQAMLEPLGLVVREIQADGHCMYKAVEDQLRLNADEGDAEQQPDFKKLRHMTAQHMREHKAEFLPFLSQDFGEAEDIDAAFEHYCSEIADTAAWGGQTELNALCQSLKQHIKVFAVGLPPIDMGSNFIDDEKPSLLVCYLRHALALGEHFNSLAAEDSDEEDEQEES